MLSRFILTLITLSLYAPAVYAVDSCQAIFAKPIPIGLRSTFSERYPGFRILKGSAAENFLRLAESDQLLNQTGSELRGLGPAAGEGGGLCGTTCMSNLLAIIDGDLKLTRIESRLVQRKRVETILSSVQTLHSRNAAYGISMPERVFSFAKAFQARGLKTRIIAKSLREDQPIFETDLSTLSRDSLSIISIVTDRGGHALVVLAIDRLRKRMLVSDPNDPKPQISRYEAGSFKSSTGNWKGRSIKLLDLKYGYTSNSNTIRSVETISLSPPAMPVGPSSRDAEIIFHSLSGPGNYSYLADRNYQIDLEYQSGGVDRGVYVERYLITDSVETTSILVKRIRTSDIEYETIPISSLREIRRTER